VADYSVDIAVALKGAKKLTDFNKTVDNTTKNIKALNHNLKTTSKDQKLVIKSFDNLNKVLSTAKSNFNSVASGTKLQTKAARQLIAAEKQLNREYNQRENLLNRLRGTGPMPLPGTGVGRDPVASSIERRRRKLMRGANQYSSPLGPFQASPLEMIPGFGMGSLQGQTSPVSERIANELRERKGLTESLQRLEAKSVQNLKDQVQQRRLSRKIGQDNLRLVEKRLLNEQKIAQTVRQARRRSIMRGATGAVSSGIIGGGFPLLFGQGPTAAIGGALGGVAGGALSAIPGMGQFGFALSIAGTAIGSAIDDLTNALAKPTENIESLVNKFGLVGTSTGDLALELEKLGMKSAAATLLLEKGKEEFGLTTDEIEENTEKMQEFKNGINKLGTEITLFLANHLTPFLKELRNFDLEQAIMGPGGKFKDFFGTGKNIGEKALSLLLFGPGGDPTKQVDRFIKKGKGMSNIPVAEGNPIIDGVPLNPDFQKPGTVNEDISKLEKRLQVLKETAKFNKNILPLQQALDIESKRLTLSSSELRVEQAKNNITNTRNEMLLKAEEFGLRASDELADELLKLEHKLGLQRKILDNAETLAEVEKLSNEAALKDLNNRLSIEQRRFELSPKEIKILQAKNKLSAIEDSILIAKTQKNDKLVASLLIQRDIQQELVNQAILLANPIEAEMILLDQQLKQLLDTGNMVVGLSQTISSSFQNSFKGVITGTMTVTDAFRNMTSRISSYFLDMAAKIMATRVQQSILGLFNFGGGGGLFSSFVGNSSLTGAFSPGAGGPSPLLGFRAGGGSVRGGGSYVVGERGPEMFTPGVSGTVTPNHVLGGNTNIVVNVDASGTEVEGDEASSSQLGKLIGLAVQQELVKQSRAGGLLSKA
tara:strand:+ start:2415 stop:5057 length:2643 start_codon:yes stop_codon:yes gene_type:complete